MAEKKNISSGAEKAEKLTRKGKKHAAKTVEDKEIENLASNKETPAKSTKSTKKANIEKSESGSESEKGVKKTGSAKRTGKRAAKSSKGEEKQKVERKHKEKARVKKNKKKTSKLGAKLSERRKERKERREERKLERAKISAEKKQARIERRLAHKEKLKERAAAMKDRREERKEKRKERRDLLKNESKQARRKRIAEERKAKREAKAAKHEKYLAEKKAKREHNLKVRAEKRAERNEKRHAPGFGGWLAAVITLGVTTLALGTVLTFGWLSMNNMQADMATGYTQSLYELNSVVDELDTDLARAKASSSSSDRVKVFSDIAIESETAETILERFPLDMQMTEQLSSFVNNMGESARQMLYTVARGGELSAAQQKSLEYMYETNAKVKAELNKLIETCDGKEMLAAMRGKSNALGDGFTVIQNNTFELPEGIEEGPFSTSVKKLEPAILSGEEEITAQTAEELAKAYFKDYKVSEANCTGEAVGANLTLYNVNVATPDGEMLVQLSKAGGKVVVFDSFKDCSQHNFSVDRCVALAEDFLADIGYDGLKAVWASENGTTCNLHFAPLQDGAILYPDLIKVKVCEERGIVTGMEAIDYVMNHAERKIADPVLSEEQAKGEINGNMEVFSARKAVIPFNGGERLCHEFFGELDGSEYFIYVDAATGEELEVLTVVNTAQGKAIM